MSIQPGFRWDKYEATVPACDPMDMLRFWNQIGEPEEARPCQGYGRAVSYQDQVRVWWDGHNGQFGPHVVIEGGAACSACVDMLRAQWPVHRVTRGDVCLDVDDGPGTFDRVQVGAYSIARAQKPAIETMTYGDWLDKIKGRTLYIGGRYSTHRARIYEKGKEQVEKQLRPDASPTWVRIEYQVRPQKEAREGAAYMTPLDFARSNKWTSQITQMLGQSVGHGVLLTTPRIMSDSMKAFEYMLNTYSATMKRLITKQELTEEQIVDAVRKTIQGKQFDLMQYLQ